MTGFDAVDRVYRDLIGLELSLEGGIYQLTKPMRIEEDEFIVINSLPVFETELQIAHVNVNVFVRDVEPGTPNNDRLKTLVDQINELYPFGAVGQDIQVFKDRTAIIADDDYERHYVNILLKVIMLNK